MRYSVRMAPAPGWSSRLPAPRISRRSPSRLDPRSKAKRPLPTAANRDDKLAGVVGTLVVIHRKRENAVERHRHRGLITDSERTAVADTSDQRSGADRRQRRTRRHPRRSGDSGAIAAVVRELHLSGAAERDPLALANAQSGV